MNTATEKLNKELSSIEPDTIIELFEIDFSSLQNHIDMLKLKDNLNLGSEPVYRFYAGKNLSNPVYWQDNGYQPLPIELEDFESKSDGTLPRPKLTILNVDGLLSRIVSSNDDFVGCRVTRKRTFAKFLDGQNFQNRNYNEEIGENPFGASDPQAHLPDDIFFINRKVAESKDAIQFELASALELGNTQLPGRTVLHNYCTWKYRCDVGCRFGNGSEQLPVSDVNNKTFVIKLDSSGKVIEEGYGLSELRVSDKDDIFEWSEYGASDVNGAWQKGTPGESFGYKRGDVSKISPTFSNKLTDDVCMYFVCIKSHSAPSVYHPLNSASVWIRDNCSRGLEGCIQRYGYNPGLKPGQLDDRQMKGGGEANSDPMNLPFGGFPGTSKYGF